MGANGIAIAVTLFPEGERGKVLGLSSATVGFSALVAPAVGGIVVEAGGWRWAYHALALPAVVGAVGAWLVLEAGRLSESADGRAASIGSARAPSPESPSRWCWASPWAR